MCLCNQELMMSFQEFLHEFVRKVQTKSRQVNQAVWLLETTGSPDAASLKAELDVELRMLFHDKETYEKLLAWDQDPSLVDPLLKRQLNVLIRTFKPNQIPQTLIEQIAKEEAALSLAFSNFRPSWQGKTLSDNDIRYHLKHEEDPEKRKQIWEASKEIGQVLAPQIIQVVELRNQAARHLGYDHYFTMQLELQEVNEKSLFAALDQLAQDSDHAYQGVIDEIMEKAARQYGLPREQLGPWIWSEPFGQEDPLDTKELDELAQEIDIVETSRAFYQKMGFDVTGILERSDQFERPGKNQHAFCIHIDREGDVRTLNNVKPSIKWLETMLHELGHAVYELGYAEDLPWLLREPPHMITTEAMALVAGRQAYRPASLNLLVGDRLPHLKKQAEMSLRRRQLIFSRWVLVMTYFERELYRNPHQDLQKLWWELVAKYQKIHSTGSRYQCDWAAKYHIGQAPVYYFSYLLGELLASYLETATPHFTSEATGAFLKEKLFRPGNRFSWDVLIQEIIGSPLQSNAWLKQFG